MLFVDQEIKYFKIRGNCSSIPNPVSYILVEIKGNVCPPPPLKNYATLVCKDPNDGYSCYTFF